MMMTAKIAAVAAASSVCVLFLAVPVLADDMRPASKAEIVRHLGPNATGKTDSAGFTYKPGSSKGYKVANASICIRSPNGSVNCAKILTDGTKFQMVTPDGARGSF